MIHYFNPSDKYALNEFSKTLTILMDMRGASFRKTKEQS